ncbi:hypothetical protein ACO0QE_004093 [Hanseniaspora vineae]
MSQLFELQVVLVPPSGRTPVFLEQILQQQPQQQQFFYNPGFYSGPSMGFPVGIVPNQSFTNGFAMNSQSATNSESVNQSGFPNNPDITSNRSFFAPQMHSGYQNPAAFKYSEVVKFLLLINPSKSLLELAELILVKCSKLYPNLASPIIISKLQDIHQNDLDMEYTVRDVFRNGKNTVLCVLKNELDFNDEDDDDLDADGYNHSLSQLQLGMKRNVSLINQPIQNKQHIPSITVQKKRKSNIVSGNSRVSTPLAKELYTKSTSNSRQKQVDNNIDELLAAERSVLPPPPPQSPPMRISSRIESKRIISAFSGEDDAVSRSEQVDPDKSKRMYTETPLKAPKSAPGATSQNPSSMAASSLFNATPNKFTMTGQRVVSATNTVVKNNMNFSSNVNSFNHKAKNQPKTNAFATPSFSARKTRSVSGRLIIPEPKISEAEEQLHEGPSSPFSGVLPPKADRIPMKQSPRVLNNNINSESESTCSEYSESAHEKEHDDSMKKEHAEKKRDPLPKSNSTESVNFTPLKQTSEDVNDVSPTKKNTVEDSNKSVELAKLPPNKAFSQKNPIQANDKDLMVVDLKNIETKKFSDDSDNTNDSSDDGEFEKTIKKHDSGLSFPDADNDVDMDSSFREKKVYEPNVKRSSDRGKRVLAGSQNKKTLNANNTHLKKSSGLSGTNSRASSPEARLKDLNVDPLKEDLKQNYLSRASKTPEPTFSLTQKENQTPVNTRVNHMQGINSPLSAVGTIPVGIFHSPKNIMTKKDHKSEAIGMTETETHKQQHPVANGEVTETTGAPNQQLPAASVEDDDATMEEISESAEDFDHQNETKNFSTNNGELTHKAPRLVQKTSERGHFSRDVKKPVSNSVKENAVEQDVGPESKTIQNEDNDVLMDIEPGEKENLEDKNSKEKKITIRASKSVHKQNKNDKEDRRSSMGDEDEAISEDSEDSEASGSESSEASEDSDESEDSEGSEDDDDDDEDDEDDEDEAIIAKPRRVVVNTPKGPVSRVSSSRDSYESKFQDEMHDLPQSTQVPLEKMEPAVTFGSEKNDSLVPPSPVKTPVENKPKFGNSALVSPPTASVAKTRFKKAVSSLGSLHDLVSRGVPTVHDKPLTNKFAKLNTEVSQSSDEESQNESDTSNGNGKKNAGKNDKKVASDVASSDSDSSSDETSSDDSSDDDSDDDSDSDDSDNDSRKKKFISAKTVNKVLRKNKKSNSSGFASLVKDSQKNKSTVL